MLSIILGTIISLLLIALVLTLYENYLLKKELSSLFTLTSLDKEGRKKGKIPTFTKLLTAKKGKGGRAPYSRL